MREGWLSPGDGAATRLDYIFCGEVDSFPPCPGCGSARVPDMSATQPAQASRLTPLESRLALDEPEQAITHYYYYYHHYFTRQTLCITTHARIHPRALDGLSLPSAPGSRPILGPSRLMADATPRVAPPLWAAPPRAGRPPPPASASLASAASSRTRPSPHDVVRKGLCATPRSLARGGVAWIGAVGGGGIPVVGPSTSTR